MVSTRAALIITFVVAVTSTACNRPSAEAPESAPVGTSGEPTAGRAEGCSPVETREANVPDQRPSFPGQTRACAAPSSVPVDVAVVAKGLQHPWAVEPLPGGGSDDEEAETS